MIVKRKDSFFPGLTTKTEAADISGRGVGLDLVMSNIKEWGGEVELVNRPGLGIKISLRLPITNTLCHKYLVD